MFPGFPRKSCGFSRLLVTDLAPGGELIDYARSFTRCLSRARSRGGRPISTLIFSGLAILGQEGRELIAMYPFRKFATLASKHATCE